MLTYPNKIEILAGVSNTLGLLSLFFLIIFLFDIRLGIFITLASLAALYFISLAARALLTSTLKFDLEHPTLSEINHF